MATLEGILNSVTTHPHLKHLVSYLLTFTHPGGVRDAKSFLGHRAAMLAIDNHNKEVKFEMLQRVNAALTKGQTRLETHNPEWSMTGFRAPKEVYYYPNCPRGVPLKDLHRHVFAGNEEKIKEYDDLLAPRKVQKDAELKKEGEEDRYERPTWFTLLEEGRIKHEDKLRLFKRVSSDTHGTPSDFIRAWDNLLSEFKEANPLSIQRHPLLFAVSLHDLVLQYMPYVNGNRRLARLVMAHHLVKNGIYPPMFWSSVSYERFISSETSVSLKNPAAMEAYLALRNKRIAWIVNLVSEGQSIAMGRPKTEQSYEQEILETWQHLARQQIRAEVKDFGPAAYSYIKSRGRVLIPDLLSALSIYTDPRGSQIINLPDANDAWIWSGTSKPLASAISEGLKKGILKVVPAHEGEYRVLRCVPEFKPTSCPQDKWKPVALVVVG